jgi:2-hydroxy-6-oxonona-2,4-dienedioate hydrolase
MTKSRVVRLGGALTGIIVAGALGLVSASYGRDISQARNRIASGSRIAQTACGPIEYAEAGSGPTVLVVHGAGGGYDQGMDLGFDLAKRGFHVIAVSRFGYLRTPLPADGSAAAQADAHACLLDALNVKTASVFGASAGAPSTMQFALRYPDRTRSMVLLVPAVYVPRPGGAPSVKTPAKTNFMFNTALGSDFLFWTATKVARPTLIRSILGTPTSDVENASPEERARVELVLDHILPVSTRRDGLMNDAEVVSSLPRYDLEKISVPTLAISVENDGYGTYDGARYTAANVPGARFIGFRTGGHILVGHSQEMVAEIAGFLNSAGRQ